jgi:hypothetical protein
VDERRFGFSEACRRNHRVYRRVKADGVELPSLVCIFESQQRVGFEEELRMSCKNYANRRESGAILEANLEIRGT